MALRDWLLLVAVAALAVGLRVHGIDRIDVWVDEANAFLTAQRSVPVILQMLRLDSSPPAYYIALHFWLGLFGTEAAALRAFAVLGGVATVPAVFAVGRRWFSTGVGLWAAFLVAASPMAIFSSQQVRMYSWLPLLALGAVWWLVRFLDSQRPRDLAVCLGLTALALYTHNFAFHLLPVLAAVVAVSGQLWTRWKSWALSALVLAALYAPWVPTFLKQAANENHYAWYLPLWNAYGTLGVVSNTFKSYSPAAEFAMFEYKGATDWYGIPAAALAALALFGAASLWRRRETLGKASATWAVLLAALPMFTAIGVSSVLTPHYVPGRVDQMMFPAFALLAAVGVCAMRPAALRVVVGVAVLVLCVITKGVFFTDYREYRFRGGDRAMANAIRDRIAPGDVVLCTSLTRASLEYYLRDDAVQLLSFPRETAGHLGAQNDWRWLADRSALKREAQAALDRVRRRAGPQGRLFLARSRLSVNDALAPEALHRDFGIRQLENLGRYIQIGTEDVIWLSVNQLRLPPREASAP
jgi:4-amino-4-deoxy-L-arabinose transferase-like glycosyltransferase